MGGGEGGWRRRGRKGVGVWEGGGSFPDLFPFPPTLPFKAFIRPLAQPQTQTRLGWRGFADLFVVRQLVPCTPSSPCRHGRLARLSCCHFPLPRTFWSTLPVPASLACRPKDPQYGGEVRTRGTHTPSVAFRHLPPNAARTGYATKGALFGVYFCPLCCDDVGLHVLGCGMTY